MCQFEVKTTQFLTNIDKNTNIAFKYIISLYKQHFRLYHRMGEKRETARAEQHKSRQCTNQHQYSLHTV